MSKPQVRPRAVAPRPPLRKDVVTYLLLLAAIMIAYSQVRSCAFVNYDDREYVTENAWVRAGLSPEGLRLAFTSTIEGNWIPLTWISHMACCSMFGLDPGSHHLANLFLHSLSTLLLFGLLKRMTGAHWRSAAVASLFALHPVHVESVAWIAERKDVLSAFFGFLTVWAYVRYAGRESAGRYLLALGFSAWD